jgi:pimeloyl-ACP methyl ester carboxylesterase
MKFREVLMFALWVGVASVPTAWAQQRVTDSGSKVLELRHKTLKSHGGTTIEADAGTLLVPENRSNTRSRSIPIAFLRLRSTAAHPRAPLFFLQGGPGSRGVSENPHLLEAFVPFLAVSDLVLIDQRGVADSLLQWEWDGPPPLNYFMDADSALRQEAEMSRRASAAIRARGVDLTGYTTVQSAADLDALREALGAPRVSLLAFSYGTHLACAYLRAFGTRVESVVMLGTEGPDQTYKLPWAMDTQFRKLAILAGADPRINKRVPDLVALYDRVIARLEREPMIVSLPAGKDTLRLPIGPFGLRLILRFDVGDATDLVVFPRLLWSIDHGDPSVLEWFVRKRAGIAVRVHAMGSVMDAASGVTAGRRALIDAQAKTSRFADVVNFPYQAEDIWNAPDLGDAFRSPLISPVRTLFVSGDLDFNTPPYQAEELRWGMTNTTHLIVEHAGHEQTFWQNDTAVPVIVDFLAGRDVRDRTITYPALRFVPLEGTDAEVTHPSVSR